jgi:hypothetical protein
LKVGVDDLVIKDLEARQRFIGACVGLQVSNMAVEAIPVLQNHYDCIKEENVDLPDPNSAVLSKEISVTALSEDDKVQLYVEVVDPSTHREKSYHARDCPYFSCIVPFSGDCKLDESDVDQKCVVSNWLGAVWCSPMISLISTAKTDAASFNKLKSVLRLFLSRVKGTRWVDRTQVCVPVAATVSALRGFFGIMCHVPCAGGCTRDDVDFICPASRGSAAAIISEIPVAGRILMTQVKDCWQDEVQSFHVARVKDLEYSPALDLATQCLDDLVASYQSKQTDVSGLVKKVNSILQEFLQLLPKLEGQRPLWHEDFLPVFVRVARAVTAVKRDYSVLPDGIEGALQKLAAVVKGIRSKKAFPSELQVTLNAMVQSNVHAGAVATIKEAAAKYVELPSYEHMLDMGKKLSGQPSLPPDASKCLEDAFVVMVKLLREGLELGFEVCEARTTFLKACEGRFGDANDNEKYRTMWLSIFMEMTNVHKAEVEMAASSDLEANLRDASIRDVSTKLRALGDALTSGAQQAQENPQQNVCYTGFMKSYGAWREGITKNLQDNVTEMVKDHCKTMNSTVHKLRQICRGAAGGKNWYDAADMTGGKTWLENYKSLLFPLKKAQAQTLLDALEKA